ncbi:T9SS type A sorting domain-containing protein [Chryseobacterium artocarpi]|uniref:T9SS type A sorting domain-containing protein n=1 Tax=Chryseobacterium artocarpi TaxID=1414727 RepID=UPI003F342688
MKKILLMCLMSLGVGASAQIQVNDGFEGSSALPLGWSYSALPSSASQNASIGMWTNGTACAGSNMVYRNIYSGVTAQNVIYSTTHSNGLALDYSFQYAAKGFGTSGAIKGGVSAEYSIDGGTTWVPLMTPVVLNNPNSSPVPCTTVSGTLPAGAVPAGANFKFKLTGSYTSPADFYIGFDEVKLNQPVVDVPGCTTLTAPANAATGASRTPVLKWNAAAGASSYNINVGTTPGGNDVINNLNVGNVLTYTIPTANPLNYSTTYYVKIIPTNSFGNATACTETSFTTLAIGCPSVSLPESNATNIGVTPTISWTAVSGATGYRLTVGTTAGGTEVLNNVDLGNVLTYTFPSNLNYNTTYHYKVNSYQGSNSTSASCTVRKFKTKYAPPANDDCANAIPLGVNSDMSSCTIKGTGNTLGGTLSLEAPTCSGFSGDADDDVWYSFVATGAAHTVTLSNIVSTGASSTTDMYFQVLSGTCGNFTNLICNDPNSATISGLTPGQTYYVRVYTYDSGADYTASFDICIGTLPAAPANNECSTAVPLTVSATSLCTNSVAGTTLGATDSGVAIAPCTGTADDDVWYSFVATSASHVVALTDVVSVGTTSSTSLYLQVLSGACGAMTSVLCDTSYGSPAVLTGLTAGNTYYVRVYNSSTGPGNANTFNICVTTPVAPSNDDCAGAIALTVNPTTNCAVVTAGTTHSATNSNVAVSPCTGTADDDVWYTFTATNPSHIITLSNIVSTGSSSSTSLYMQVMSGACGTLTSVKCSTVSVTMVEGLTVGQTYYIRLYNSNGSGYSNSFNICVGTPPPPPANDDCANAIPLTVNPNLTCTTVTAGTTTSATNSNVPTGSCSGTPDDDVWYTFTATGASHVVKLSDIVSTGINSSTSLYLQVFSGGCGTMTSLKCSTSGTATVEGLTAGQTYYIRVYNSNGSGYSNNFKICVGTTPPPPVNDDCSGAIALTPGANFNANAIIASNISASTNGTSSCVTPASNNVNNVWFSVVVPPSGSVTVETGAVPGSSFNDSIMEVYSGTCGSFTSLGCNDDIVTTTNIFSKVSVTGQTPGSVIYVSVWRYGSKPDGDFKISAYDASLATSETSVVKNEIKVYPNPFTDILNISDISKIQSVSVVDLAGRVVKTINTPSSVLQLGDLKQGMYLIILNMKDGSRHVIKSIKK